MRFLLLYAGAPVGRIVLDGGQPAAGWLEPLPAYERLRPALRRAGDLLWVSRFQPESEDARAAVAEAEALKPHLSLATEPGAPVTVASVDLWDDSIHGEPPFVLVYFRGQPAAVGAAVPPRRGAGGEGSRPAA